MKIFTQVISNCLYWSKVPKSKKWKCEIFNTSTEQQPLFQKFKFNMSQYLSVVHNTNKQVKL